jgi:DNA-directed RNA polymerase specialized sigma24 family protein
VTPTRSAISTRHVRAVQSYCLWRTADVQSAEDATATVFLEIWRKRECQTPKSPSEIDPAGPAISLSR